MADRHIDMRAHDVRAILREIEAPGTGKTQTRRLPKITWMEGANHSFTGWRPERVGPKHWQLVGGMGVGVNIRAAYAHGDRLWVREAFNAFQFSQDGDDAWPVKVPTLAECREADDLAYRYGAPQIVYRESDRARKWFADQPWRSPIHMPRWASRLTLIVTDVRVQRLWQITDKDAIAEGIQPQRVQTAKQDSAVVGWGYEGLDSYGPGTPKAAYRNLWNSLHGPDAWAANPWVAASTFRPILCNIDRMPGVAG